MNRFLSVALLVVMLGVAWPEGQAQGSRPQFDPDTGIARLERERGAVRARIDDTTETLRLLEGNLDDGVRGDPQGTARRFFTRYGDIFGLTDPAIELAVERTDRDRRGYTSIRFEQRYAGLPVLGGDIRADIDRTGRLHTVHGALVPFPRPPTVTPTITSMDAMQRARAVVGGTVEGVPHLVVMRRGIRDHLAWTVIVRTSAPGLWHIQIDARTGAALDQLQTLPTDGHIRTYDAGGSFDLPGALRRINDGAPVADQDINAAHNNATRVYDYYHATFGRDSLDGNGMAIVSSVHFLQNYNNAFWDPGQLQVVYGDGDGSTFTPLARSLDVVAHELTHGLTQFTAQLTYAGQSGALNEAYSDVFGALIDTSNWEIAEAVYTPDVPGDALRSLADPTRYGQPSVLGEYIILPNSSSGDYGGVHVNSGIINHVAYSIAQRLGRDKLAQIAYRTLTMKLTSDSDFIAARDLTVQACGELIDPPVVPAISAADCRLVRQLFTVAGWDDQTTLDDLHRVYVPQLANGAPICRPNAIRNGDFEDGERAWPNTGSVYGSVIDRWPVEAETISARLTGNTQLLQLVRRDVPGSVRLRFDVYKTVNAASEALEVSFEDATTYADLRTPIQAGMDIPTGTWTTVSLTANDLAAVASFRLMFRYGSGGGDIYIDNIVIEQEC